ncbi:hypothetical protein GCM10010985_50270 [Caballeronia grimmiae]|uniref:Uncharacterized protein n=1 Tax=Caballeronia grimmiae TaxID=1071679 RepID=A0ABQ1S4W7_9BURK|nr:hypothetical protein GCM10010985_50270 [Caballeronia grimmiae]
MDRGGTAGNGGSARAVWLAHKDAGYLLTENARLRHYLVHDRGGQQNNFVQVFLEAGFPGVMLFGWNKGGPALPRNETS